MKMVLSHQDHPLFSMVDTKVVGSVKIIEILTNQGMIDKETQCKTSKEIHHTISRDLCKGMEGTIGLHKIIHLNKIMVSSHQ